MKTNKIALEEIELWVLNDGSLYNWLLRSKQPIRKFIKENREELTNCILEVLNRKPNER